MSRYCPICGMPVSANAKYCRNCGQKLRIISKKTDNSAEEKTKDIVSEQTGNNNISARTNQVSEEDSVVNNTESDTVYVKTDTIQTGYVKEKKADDSLSGQDSNTNIKNLFDDKLRFYVLLLVIGFFCYGAIHYITHSSDGIANDTHDTKPAFDTEIADVEEPQDKQEVNEVEVNTPALQEETENTNTQEEKESSIEDETRKVTIEQILDEFSQQNWEAYAALVFEYLDVFDIAAITQFAEQSSKAAEVQMIAEKTWASFVHDPTEDDKVAYYTLVMKDNSGNEIELLISEKYDSDKSTETIQVTDQWGVIEYIIYDDFYTVYKEPIISEGRLAGVRTYVISDGKKELVRVDTYEYLDYPSDGLYEDIDYAASQDSSIEDVYSLFDSNGRLLYCSYDSTKGKYTYFQNVPFGEVYSYYDEQGNMVREKTYEIRNGQKVVCFNEYAYENGQCINEYNYDENWALEDSVRREFNGRGDLTGVYITVSGYSDTDFTVEQYSYNYDEYGRISLVNYEKVFPFEHNGELYYTYY